MHELRLATFIVELPDHYFAILEDIAEAKGETPETIAQGLIGTAIEQSLFFHLELYKQSIDKMQADKN